VRLEREARWSSTPFADELEYILQLTTVCRLQQTHTPASFNAQYSYGKKRYYAGCI